MACWSAWQAVRVSVSQLADLMCNHSWLALTGAGISTDSGIPDYRGPSARPTKPMQYAEFVNDPVARQRYWARSMMGWRSFGKAAPNRGHQALARLQEATDARGVITQNVDGLHLLAGSRDVVELHGAISRVICLDCGSRSARSRLQARLEAANPSVQGEIPAGHAELRPDGDADVAETSQFVVVDCEECGGSLKPDLVFFGENVPKPRVERAYDQLDGCELLVVLGSSLTVMSGLRFARQQAKRGRLVVCVNQGPTRGDELFGLKIEDGCSEVLTQVATELGVDESRLSPTATHQA